MKTKIPYGLLILAMILNYSTDSYAQKATEIYIPIGQSPGLSGQYSKIGTITSVSEISPSFVVTDSLDNTHAVIITDTTHIWLDKSKMNQRNTEGSVADIETGKLVEVKYYLASDSTYSEIAEWIKIQLTGE